MSVSSHLADRSSPLRRFFEAELGNTRELVSEANATLRGGQTRPPLPTVGNPGLVGTAADILLNAWLDPVEPPGRMAQSPTMDGARFIGDSQFALMGRFKQPDPPKPDEWPRWCATGCCWQRSFPPFAVSTLSGSSASSSKEPSRALRSMPAACGNPTTNETS